MTQEITRLDSPIDVMYLMHEAFEAASARTEALAAEGEKGGDLKDFEESFGFWVKQLLYHATTEDTYMTDPLTDSQPARDNEAEHAELARQGGELIEFLDKGDSAGLEENVSAAIFALEEQQHKELVEKAQEVEQVLRKMMGEERVLTRTRRHLYRRVMALRVLEFDHFENEEAFVLPLVRESMTEHEMLAVAKHLRLDEGADDPRWIIDWVASELQPVQRKLLSDLEARFSEVPA